MSALFYYNAAYPVVGALTATGLTPRLVADMVLVPNVTACFALLSRAAGVPQLREAQDGSLEAVDSGLRGVYFDYGQRVLRFLGGKAAETFRLFLAEADIHNVKMAFRRILSAGTNESDLPPFLWVRNCYVNLQRMCAAESLNALERLIAASPLAEVIRDGVRAWNTRKDLFFSDMAMDRSYRQLLWREASRLCEEEGSSAARELMGPLLALRDLVLVLRLKRYYEMTPEDIYHYLVLPEGFIGPNEYPAITRSTDLAELLPALPKGPLAEFLSRFWHEGMGPGSLEIMGKRLIWQKARSVGPRGFFEFGTFLKFMLTRQMLVEDTIAVLQARRLGLPDGTLRQFLVTQG